MERIDHVDVIEIGRRRLIRQIDRMLQRQIPNRERLEFGISRFDAMLVFMVEL